MPIHTQNYRHWEGTLNPQNRTRWWVIAKAELKILAKRKIVRLIVVIPPVIYFLAHAILIYLGNLFENITLPYEIDPGFFQGYLFRMPDLSGFLVAIISIFGGAGLIADDLRSNALSLYLSKPITWYDYLIGKFIVVGTLLVCLTLVPGLLLFLEHTLLADFTFFKEHYWTIFSIIIYSAIITVITSLLMLFFSSLTTNSRYATIGFCAVWFGLPVIALILKEAFSMSTVSIVSLWANYDILGSVLFGESPDFDIHWVWTILVLSALTAVCLFVLRLRIRAVQIVK